MNELDMEPPGYWIAAHCDPAELTRRETAQGNRVLGLAASQFDWIHQKMQYDFEIDTTGKTPEAAAAELTHWFSGRPTPSAMRRLREQLNATWLKAEVSLP